MKTLSLDLPLKNLSNQNKITYKEKRRSVFFLHGYGSNKEDLYPICNYFSKDWVCISLEATIPVNNNGWAWAELNYNNIESVFQNKLTRLIIELIYFKSKYLIIY